MFDEIQFDKINRLPKYLFAEIKDLTMKLRREGVDIIDFSMGNPGEILMHLHHSPS